MTTSLPRRWYLAKDKKRLGPFSVEQLRQMAATGMIQHSDMTLEEGQTKWQAAGTIEGIWPQALPLRPPRPDAITCPSCKTPASYNGHLEGRTVRCPRCKSNFKMQRNAASISNNASPKNVDNRPTPTVARIREPWNRKKLGIVASAVAGTILILLIGFWTAGNTRTESSKEGEKQLAQAGDDVHRTVGKTEQKESAELAEELVRVPEKPEKPPLPEKRRNQEDQTREKQKDWPQSEKKPGREEQATERQKEQVSRRREILKQIAELDQLAKRDILEIDKELREYRIRAAFWEQRKQALEDDPRFPDPFNAQMMAAYRDVQATGRVLQKDIQRISLLIEDKKMRFEQKRQALLARYPEANLLTWQDYYGEGR